MNLIDWSSKDILAVALNNAVYMWNINSESIDKIQFIADPEHEKIVTSVSWNEDGSKLAFGTNDRTILIYDANTSTMLNSIFAHNSRIGSLAWNNHILSSGSREGLIVHSDPIRQSRLIQTQLHGQEVCGLKWSPNGVLLASGGNDNVLNIWDNMKTTPLHRLTQHTASVKAIAWCPWDYKLLASGGGTTDRTLKFWNVDNGRCIKSIETCSQISSVIWAKHGKELITSHGYTKNQLIVWDYSSLTKIAELIGHKSRVLNMTQSPDGSRICSGDANEILLFWNIFEAQKLKTEIFSPLSIRRLNIR